MERLPKTIKFFETYEFKFKCINLWENRFTQIKSPDLN